jgi:hypothetical protein
MGWLITSRTLRRTELNWISIRYQKMILFNAVGFWIRFFCTLLVLRDLPFNQEEVNY